MKKEMKGSLQLLVLHALSEKSLNGYTLIKEVEDYFGKRPSTGTMYPLLDKLREEKCIVQEKKGRSVVYIITKDGLKRYKELIKIDLEQLKKKIQLHAVISQKDLSSCEATISSLLK